MAMLQPRDGMILKKDAISNDIRRKSWEKGIKNVPLVYRGEGFPE